MTTPMTAAPSRTSTLRDRYILTQVSSWQLAVPATWVREIARIKRSQLLNLPFYNPLVWGVVHHNGQVLPLVSTYRLFTGTGTPLQETATVICLAAEANALANVGLVVDKAIGTVDHTAVADSITDEYLTLPIPEGATLNLQSTWITDSVWQPQRWSAL